MIQKQIEEEQRIIAFKEQEVMQMEISLLKPSKNLGITKLNLIKKALIKKLLE